MNNEKSASRLRRAFPSPALIVAFVALFAALGGFGYAAVKMKPNSVGSKNIKAGAVTTGKIADGAVTTPKLAPDAVAPSSTSAVNAMNAARLGGAAPGQCQTGWLKASVVINTAGLNDANPDAVVPGFDCASKADNAIQVHREATGLYTVTLAGLNSGTALSSSAGANAVTAASPIDHDGALVLKVWNNSDAQFVDGKTVSLIAF
jgi:hypothetical protein